MDKVSIIVPFYNVEKYFEACLESISAQNYENFNVILIDDCGTDGSRKIAERYIQNGPLKFSLITNESNIGQGRSRMKGVQESDADYIMFVDSDDYISPDYISTFVKENTDQYDIIIAGFTRDTDGKLTRTPPIDSELTLLLYPVACCKMYKRKYIIDNHVDFSDARKGEDIYFSLAFYAGKPKYKIIPYTGYFYRLNRSSTTKSMNFNNDFEKTIVSMFSLFRKKYSYEYLPLSMKENIEYAYAANIVNALIIYGHGCGREHMLKKLAFVENDISENYPDIMRNQLLRHVDRHEVSMKIRLGVAAFYWSRRLGLYKSLFTIISLI